MKKYHYVYYSYEQWGRGYIGARTCSCPPTEDLKYFGSFKDKSFKPTNKIILFEFATREEALEAEICLHNFYEVHINQHFANQAKQTATKFNRQGLPGTLQGKQHSTSTREKMRRAKLGTKRPLSVRQKQSQSVKGAKNPFYGKEHTQKTKQKISASKKGKPGTWIGRKHSEETKQKMREAKLKNREAVSC
jgi:hypothetical protein